MLNSWIADKEALRTPPLGGIGTIKAGICLFFLAVIIYSNSLGGSFISDDGYFIVKNIHIKSLANIPSFFVSPTAVAFAELSHDVYRPVTAASYAVDYHLWRLNTFGYHLENVLLHALNAILLFILLRLILGNIFVAFLASAFFVCHPVQTEVVSWISGRSSILFLLFYLLAFITYALNSGKTGKALPALSLAFFFAALFSKEMAVSLPLLLLAYDIHFGGKESIKSRLTRLAPYFLMAALFVIIRFLVINRISQIGWWGGSPYHTFLTMTVVMADYVKLLIAPFKLCAFYVTTIYDSITITKVLLSIFFLIAVMAAVPFVFRISRRVSFAICIFFITLLPVSNIVPLRALMAERFLYLPSVGFYILVAILLERIAQVHAPRRGVLFRRASVILAAMLILFYSARTMARNEDWKSSEALSESMLRIDPLNPWALMSLGVAYSTQERYEEAIKPLEKSITLSDSFFAPKSILGFCYLQLGRNEDAVRILTDALKIRPHNLEALSSLGVAYANLKRYDDARERFELALKLDPFYVDGYINLATVYSVTGDPEKAISIYKKIGMITRSPEAVAIAYIRMGDVYVFKLKDRVMAKKCYEKAADLCGPGMDELKKTAINRMQVPWMR
ncbi:MAG: tetratricopeptide repeat protein [Candidatus Omnitrophica bacterium]|nr:tetratricopeptide repeat protein [Candidatus Omnitrophota bacterium]